ncbi:hypothetical protein, partial [Blastomonas sp. CCH2-E1]|uniref:hypothetical protein n=1 Tax=Blastomonas sp. CCH2-E1 TaxID=1768740 RepID=UPI001E42C163
MTSLTLQYSRTISLLDTEAQHMVGAEITGLADRYNAGGVFELKRFVDARAQSGEPRDFGSRPSMRCNLGCGHRAAW